MLQDITAIASKLLELSGNFKKARLEERAKIAKYFYKVGECLTEVAEELQAGNEPHGKIGELKVLAEKLPDAIGQEVTQGKANELSQLLRKAIGNDLENLNNDEKVIQQIQKCAGEFYALAFTVEYPGSKSSTNSKSSFTKSLLVVLGVVGLVGVSSWFVLESYFFAPDWLSNDTVITLKTRSGWLDAGTTGGDVKLAPADEDPPSGARWRVHNVGRDDRTISLETLGDDISPHGRLLDGHTANRTVGLAPSAGDDYSGAEWKVEVVDRGDRTIRLKTLGKAPGPEWLVGTDDRKVGLVQLPKSNPTGTLWKVEVVDIDD